MTTYEPATDHDLRCPEIADPLVQGPDPQRCTCRDQQGYTPRSTDWLTDGFLSLDTESTGVDVEQDRIVSATVIHIEGKATREKTWLADPGVPIPPAATAVHGIDDERAHRYGRPAPEVVDEIAGLLGEHWSADVPVLAFNAAYDLSLIDAEMRRHLGRPLTLSGPVVDPLVLDRSLDKWRKGKRTLSVACEHYGVALPELDAHTSAGDALAAARVMWKIARAYPDVCRLPLPELHDWQRSAHTEWAENFGRYLVRIGKVDDVERDWPLRRSDATGRWKAHAQSATPTPEGARPA